MTADDQAFEQFQDDLDCWDELLADQEGLTPFEDVSDAEHDRALIDNKAFAQRFSSPVLRYLLQLSIHRTGDRAEEDTPQNALAVLSRSITTLNGRIEHHWCTPHEYDLILVIGLHSHSISIETYKMVLKSMPMVNSVRITPLLPLDESPEEPAVYRTKRAAGNRVRPETSCDDELAKGTSESVAFGNS